MLGLLVIVGLYVIFAFDFNYPLGLALAILSGFLSALFFALNQRVGKKVGSYQITFYEMAGAFLGSVIYLIIHVLIIDTSYQVNFNATAVDWICILILSLVCTVYAFSVSIDLMKRLSVFYAAHAKLRTCIRNYISRNDFWKNRNHEFPILYRNVNYFIGSGRISFFEKEI